MAKDLLIEYVLRASKDYVFRCIHFDVDEDTGARSVSDIQEYMVKDTTPAEMALHNIWWPDFSHVKIVSSAHDFTLMDEPVEDYFTAARRTSLHLAICVCDFKNVYDNDGGLNTSWAGMPVMEAYMLADELNHQDGIDYSAYLRFSKEDPAIPSNIVEADIGKTCHHGSTFGKCQSSQCHPWTEEEMMEG